MSDYIEGDWIYDEETYRNIFTFTIIRASDDFTRTFEISTRKNELEGLIKCINYLRDNDQRMIGFNNLGFDYPILHEIYSRYLKAKRKKQTFNITAEQIYDIAQEQIESFKGSGFGHTIKQSDEYVRQVDLYKIHHFDNKAKATSLKMLEFNMRSKNIEDLPFPVGMTLTEEQMDVLIEYNVHDVKETKKFYVHSLSAIRMRADLTEKYGIDFTNFNDTKIGKEYFIQKIEETTPGSCYSFDSKGKRKLNQTKRPYIKVNDCLFDYYDFKRPEFIAVLNWFKKQKITETKGVFSDLDEAELGEVAQYADLVVKRKKFKGVPTAADIASFKFEHPLGWVEEQELKATQTVVIDGVKTKVNKKSHWMCWKQADTLNVIIDGFRFDFGTGGIHGSIESKIARENSKYKIKDADVASMYPNIGISNRVYPLHLGEVFCDIYQDVYEQRKSFKKGTPENAVMKLALNGVYGDSNNKFGPFYDPQYTMTVTINGQLSLCLLAEKLLTIPDLKIIQVNTDGVTVALPRESEDEYNRICKEWQEQVKLELEFADYSTMIIRDVNNYIAVYTNGKVKRKGAYQYEDLGWHQNQGGLVIPMAAEAAMLHGKDIREFITQHKEKFDFCLRTKVPRSSKLVLVYEDGRQEQQQNICRYYPCKTGGKLVKLMPALEGKEEDGDRELSIDAAWNVKTCNDIDNFSFDDIDYDYYVAEAEKLVIT
jgi:hypothetical protein